jgi:hypothetical protein
METRNSDLVPVKEPFRFQTGNNYGKGRPRGSRNKLAEALIDDLYDDWSKHGMEAITAVRKMSPAEYLKIVALVASKSEGFAMMTPHISDDLATFIEERRQKALLQIEEMGGE